MASTFTARAAGADAFEEDETFIAGVAEQEGGSGHTLTFMCCTYEPDEQDITLGMDSLRRILAYGRPSERPTILEL